MKKIFLFAAATAVALSSCSKNEVTTSMGDNQAIGFGVYTGQATKGTVVSSTSIETTGFGVFGYYHATENHSDVAAFDENSEANYMYNQKVTCKEDVWSYNPVKYWPNNTKDRLTFMAYAPYQEDIAADDADTGITLPALDATGVPTIDFSLLDAANTVDLVADMQYDLAQGNTSGSQVDAEKVEFNLEHLLTRALFKVDLGGDVASAVAEGTRIFLTEVKLVGTNENATLYDKDGENNQSTVLYSGGTFTFSNKATNENGSTPVLGTWTTLTPSTADINLDGATAGTNSILAFEDNSNSDKVGDYEVPRSMELTKVTDAVTMFKDEDSYLFLLPVGETTGLSSGEEVNVYLEYDVVTEDDNLDGGYSAITNHAIVALPAGSLAKAKAYAYTFTIGLEQVEVSATVEDWSDETTGGADVEDDNLIVND